MSIYKFDQMDDLLEVTIDIEQDIKAKNEAIKPKIENQVSSL